MLLDAAGQGPSSHIAVALACGENSALFLEADSYLDIGFDHVDPEWDHARNGHPRRVEAFRVAISAALSDEAVAR